MNSILNLRIYTPNRLFLKEVVKRVSVFGKEGLFTILPNHQDYISSFEDGMLYYTKEDDEKVYIGLNQGILTKCGREVQISTFTAIFGGGSVEELKEKIKEAIKQSAEEVEVDRKLKKSLKQIELELLQQIKLFGNRNE